MKVLLFVLALALAGCAANPVRPECGGVRLIAANAATFGMFGATHCVGEAAIDRCTYSGGDPAACRSAVFPPRVYAGTYYPLPVEQPRVIQPIPYGTPQGTFANPYRFQGPQGQQFQVYSMPGGAPAGTWANPYRIQPR